MSLWHAPDSAELTQQLVDAYVQAERPQDADVVAVSAPCNRSPRRQCSGRRWMR